jgi:hypothetical protein
MTIEQRKIASEGSAYWMQYVRLNGYAFRPGRDGLVKLSRNLDINVKHLSRCITAYLDA